MIRNNYNTFEAQKWRSEAGGNAADQELGERVYTSRLIGQNPDLLMHGGGQYVSQSGTSQPFWRDGAISPRQGIWLGS